AGFVAEHQRRVLPRQLAHQLPGRRWRVVDLAQIAQLPAPAGLRDRHRVPQLRCVQTDVSNATMLHGSPSLLEALLGLSRQPSYRIEGGSPPQEKDIRSSMKPNGQAPWRKP